MSKIIGFRLSRVSLALLAAIIPLMIPALSFASEAVPGGGEHGTNISIIFLWIAIVLILAKVSALVERVGQPAVLGEILMGICLGNLPLLGIYFFAPMVSNEIMHFLAELGVVILLFYIGMESSVESMVKVGAQSFLVATIGVVVPFILGAYVAGPLLMPGQSDNTYLFLGSILTATSVGITARVLKDIGKSQTAESRIIIGAAVIDDVMGLVILAVVSAIVFKGSVSMGEMGIILAKAIVFLIGAVLIGMPLAPFLGKFFSKIHTGVGMKFALVISFGLVFAYLASVVGLAPIVGAFAAGLILKPVHFKAFDNPEIVKELEEVVSGSESRGGFVAKIDGIAASHSDKHAEDFVDHLGHFLVPIFFVITGMQVKLEAFMNINVVLISLGLFAAAVIGKIVAGLGCGKGIRKWVVGVGMIPRGEVGLIFANMGKSLGVMDDNIFSAVVVVIMLTTLVTPPVLAALLKD
ncbi:MAG TPA: cation:proton antiporter [Nitrospirota bacterium]|nr:cation:proton antiporter [Nitrospirota bacterium]